MVLIVFEWENSSVYVDSEEMIRGLFTMNRLGLKMVDTFLHGGLRCFAEKIRMIHWLLGDLLFFSEKT